MLVELAATAFQRRWQIDIMALLWLALNGRHRLCVSNETREGKTYTEWVDSLPQTTRNEWEWVLDSSATLATREASAHTVILEDRLDPAWRLATPCLPVRKGVQFLFKPYCIVVENSLNDRAFLCQIASKSVRDALDTLEKIDGLKFVHGGGSDMLPAVKRLNDIDGDHLRHSVIFDSDGLRPQHRSSSATSLVSACEVRLLHHHVLARRAIENFIPPDALFRWARKSSKRDEYEARADAFFRLTEEQRSHYNVEDGFNGDQRRDDRAEARGMYDKLDKGLRNVLESGFGPKIKSIYGDGIVRGADFDAVPQHADVVSVRSFAEEVLRRAR